MAIKKLDSVIQIDGDDYSVVAKEAEVAEKVTNKLTIKTTEEGVETQIEFDGSEAKTIRVPNIDDFKYTNNTPTVNALGGVEVGETFTDIPITDMLTKILYPYVAPVISSTTVAKSPDTNVIEYGTNQTISSLAVQVQKKSKPITSIKLIANRGTGEELLEEKTGDTIKNGGNIPFTTSITINKGYNPALKFRVTDGDTTVDSGSISTSLVYPYYYGAVEAGTEISESTIKGLKKEVVARGSKGWTFYLDNQKAVFAYPKTYGKLKSIIDQNNFNVTSTFLNPETSLPIEINITCADNTTQAYYVYVTNAASTVSKDGFKFTFNL